MNYKKIATAAATTAIFLQSALPTFAVLDLSIFKNGAGSENLIKTYSSTITVVSQSNTTNVDNDLNVKVQTGDNEVEDNTGGDIYLTTGDVDVKVGVANELNGNVLDLEACGNCGTELQAVIAKNGADSENEIKLKDMDAVVIVQSNQARIDNEIGVKVQTGDNEVEDNTGGDIYLTTGDVDVEIDLNNMANANTAHVNAGSDECDSDCGHGCGEDPCQPGSQVDLMIKKNGVDSQSKIDLELGSAVVLTQNNQTDIDNDVEADASTGGNEAEDNTGGEVFMQTGKIDVDLKISNVAGFNTAELDGCDCAEMSVSAKIAQNGADAEATIKAKLGTALVLNQANTCGSKHKPSLMSRFLKKYKSDACFDNQVKMDLDSGKNKIKGSTGETGSDPSVITGDIGMVAVFSNLGGSNYFMGF